VTPLRLCAIREILEITVVPSDEVKIYRH